MLREAVTSSNVVSVGYDPEGRFMEVEFKANRHGVGSVYRYAPVTQEQFDEVRDAPSVGRALAVIKGDLAIGCSQIATVVDGAEIPLEAAS